MLSSLHKKCRENSSRDSYMSLPAEITGRQVTHLALVVGTQINLDGNELPTSQTTVDLKVKEREINLY